MSNESSHRTESRSIALAETGFTLNAEGIPYSQAFGDVYHSADGDTAQARHVFLAGNALPSRWQGREDFTILETGFGLGLNFLETWRALDEDTLNEKGGGPPRLHFISVEKFPLSRAALIEAHARWPEHAARSRQLAAAWPLPLAGFHRIHLAGGRIFLTLLLGDAADLLPQLVARVDAFYLDGFAPARNPEIWSTPVFKQMARLAAPGATLATWTVAGTVRDGLAAHGFSVEKRTGFASKREMLTGHYNTPALADAQAPRDRRAIVIGAGLAGATCAERLAARGWTVEVIERHPDAAQEASGNPAGLATPVINLADAPNAQLSRAAFLYALRHFAALGVQNTSPSRSRGVLRIARDERDVERFASLLRDQAYPQSLACFADLAQGAELAGREVSRAGIWFPSGTNVSPAAICVASLAHRHGDPRYGSITCRFGMHATRLEAHAGGWRVFDAAGTCVASAPVVVIANAIGALDFAQAAGLRLETVRGQVTLFRPAAGAGGGLDIAVAGESHAVPLPDGRLMLGATFQPGDDDASVRSSDHAANIARVEAMLPGLCSGLDVAQMEGRVGFRTVTHDRLPAFGAMPDAAPGLYVACGLGARGLVWAALCAELLAAQIAGEPWPVPHELAKTVAPTRFAN